MVGAERPRMPKGKPLQWRARALGLLQHQDRKACEAQFTGEEQADRAGAGDHDIIVQRQVPLEPWRRRISEFVRVITTRLRTELIFCQSLILVEATPTTTSIAATTVRLAGRPNSPDSSPIIAGPIRDPA